MILGKPTLIVFSDGSDMSFGAVAYIRWNTSPHLSEAQLLTSKNRIAPRKKLTIPPLELSGAVIGAMLRKTIVVSVNFSFDRIFHLVDSSIVRAQIQKDSYGFATFVATRIGEIQSLTEPSEWWWIPTKENPADMVTRIHEADDLNTDSVWQNGPLFLTGPISNWSISKEFTQQELPDKVGVTLASTITATSEMHVIDFLLDGVNDFKKLISVIAMLQRIFKANPLSVVDLLLTKTRLTQK